MVPVIYHIVARGVRRGLLFEQQADFERFLEFAGRFAMDLGVSIIDYCLMGNHYHLMVECDPEVRSEFLRRLNGTYALSYNVAAERTGHVFEARAKAFERWGTSVVPNVCRYLALNPVKAGMVRFPEEHPHSAYPAIVGLEPGPEWLNPNPLLENFAPDGAEARQLYRAYVESVLPAVPYMREAEERWNRWYGEGRQGGCRILGVGYVAMTCAVVRASPGALEFCRSQGLTIEDLQVFAMREMASASNRVMSAVLGVCHQTVGWRGRRLGKALAEDPELRKRLSQFTRKGLLHVPGTQIECAKKKER